MKICVLMLLIAFHEVIYDYLYKKNIPINIKITKFLSKKEMPFQKKFI